METAHEAALQIMLLTDAEGETLHDGSEILCRELFERAANHDDGTVKSIVCRDLPPENDVALKSIEMFGYIDEHFNTVANENEQGNVPRSNSPIENPQQLVL